MDGNLSYFVVERKTVPQFKRGARIPIPERALAAADVHGTSVCSLVLHKDDGFPRTSLLEWPERGCSDGDGTASSLFERQFDALVEAKAGKRDGAPLVARPLALGKLHLADGTTRPALAQGWSKDLPSLRDYLYGGGIRVMSATHAACFGLALMGVLSPAWDEGLAHGCLNASDVLVDPSSYGHPLLSPRVVDFGRAPALLLSGSAARPEGQWDPRCFTSPETDRSLEAPVGGQRPLPAADYWSLGAILLLLRAGSGALEGQLATKGSGLLLPETCVQFHDSELREAILRCTAPDPSGRDRERISELLMDAAGRPREMAPSKESVAARRALFGGLTSVCVDGEACELPTPPEESERMAPDECLELGEKARRWGRYPEAARWYLAAAERGAAGAQCRLGLLYLAGQGVPTDPAEAARWLSAAAGQGDARAQFHLGLLYDQGLAVGEDPTEAARWYRSSAEQGFSRAQYNLGVLLSLGRGVPEDPAGAARCYADAFESRALVEQGHFEAQNNLGVLYATGRGVPADPGRALELIRSGAEVGLAEAQFNLGWLYERGCGVPQDFVEAIRWYEDAANQGFAAAHFNLALFHDKGAGVPQSFSVAATRYRKAAELGYAPAQNNLGAMYEFGCGVSRDLGEAARWYRAASSRPCRRARRKLGELMGGDRVPRDAKEATEGYLRASERKGAPLQPAPRLRYESVQAVGRDSLEEGRWLLPFALRGDVDAQLRLAELCERPRDVMSDPAAASFWRRKAAARGGRRD
jgi:TPR repeat protein